MKKLLLLILLLPLATFAKEDPKQILDNAVEKMKKAGGITAQFSITQFEGTKEIGATKGHMTMLDQLYTLTTPEYVSWFDGESMWTLNRASNEVNLTKPTTTELRKSSPAALLRAYNYGYKLALKSAKLRGRDTYEITMTAIHKESRPERVIINLDKANLQPMCLRVRTDGNWTRFAIDQYVTGQTFTIESFQFQQKDFPSAEVIDLR